MGLGGGLGENTCRGTPKGTSEGTSNRIWKGTCCQAQVRSGKVQVRSRSGSVYSPNLILLSLTLK